MAEKAWETMVAYKLVWFRVAFFLFGPAIAQFMAINQTVDMDTKWAQMGHFAKTAFWMAIMYPGIISLIAFIDQSLPHAKQDLEDKRKADTDRFVKEHTGP
jgi:hypothetical protein